MRHGTPAHRRAAAQLQRLYAALNTSLIPEERIQQVENAIDTPRLTSWPGQPEVRGFAAGALGAATRMFTSPLGLGSLAAPEMVVAAKAAVRANAARRPAGALARLAREYAKQLPPELASSAPAVGDPFKEQAYRTYIRRYGGRP